MALHVASVAGAVQGPGTKPPDLGSTHAKTGGVPLSPDAVVPIGSSGGGGHGLIRPDPAPTNALYAQSDATQ